MSDHEIRIGRVKAHVARHLAGDLSLDGLADVAAISRFHWHRVFRALTGETVAELVRRERLNRAAILVVMGTEPLAGVACACGYPNLDSFVRVFRAAFGLTPAEARRSGRVPPVLLPPQTGDRSMLDVTIRDEPPAEVAALPHRGPYTEIGRNFAELGRALRQAGLVPAGPGIAIYYDDPVAIPPGELRSHAGVVVAPGAHLPPGLDRLRWPGGRMAVHVHKGPYQGIASAWDAFYRWLGASKHMEANAPCFDRYLNGPDEVAPEELLTELCIPLEG